MTHVLFLFEALGVELCPGCLGGIGRAAWSVVTFPWVPAHADVCDLIFSLPLY